MSLPVIGAVVKGLDDIVGRFKSSDEDKLRRAALEMEPLLLQLRTNLVEARHGNWFVAGARPAAMWVCVVGMGYQYILYPLLVWVWTFAQLKGNAPPALDASVLMSMLTGLLGLQAGRIYDKTRGTDTTKIGK